MKKIFRLLLYFFITGAVIFVLAAGFIFYGAYQIFSPIGGVKSERTAIVEKGQGVKEIAAYLEKENFISSAFWFETYVWLTEKQGSLQAGQYILDPGMSMAEIAQVISGGKITDDSVWVTIPEGFNLKQTKGRFLESGLSVAQKIDELKAADAAVNYAFLNDAPKEASLEGFLFPDTYKFNKDVGLKDITKKMLDNFDRKLTEKMRQDIAAKNLKIHDVITMASIIEREGKSAGDRKIISGVFWKRFADKYPLESDATLSYVFDDKKPIHSTEETKVDSPYNTYKYAGLPPGPIGNPGLEAIEAAIYPESSEYYFFLTKPDTGEAVFAKTLEQHNQNKAKYLR